MTQRILTIWPLVPLSFLSLAGASGSSCFTDCWSLMSKGCNRWCLYGRIYSISQTSHCWSGIWAIFGVISWSNFVPWCWEASPSLKENSWYSITGAKVWIRSLSVIKDSLNLVCNYNSGDIFLLLLLSIPSITPLELFNICRHISFVGGLIAH